MIINTKTVFYTPDGKEFSCKKEAIEHLENETQIYIDQCFINALKGTDLSLNHYTRVKIIEYLAGNIANIKRFIDGFSEFLGSEKIEFYTDNEDTDNEEY